MSVFDALNTQNHLNESSWMANAYQAKRRNNSIAYADGFELSGYLMKQSHDIASFKKDESILIPEDIDYNSFSGLSNEVKFKLINVKPKTLGQALRIDGVTPAAAIILLGHIKKRKYRWAYFPNNKKQHPIYI